MLVGVMVLGRAGCVAVAMVVGCAAARAQRLPGGVTPVHYSLTITPDLARARFAGSEMIDVVLAAPTRAIVLNAVDLEFGSVSTAVLGNSAPEIQHGTVVVDAEKQQATLTFARALPAGAVRLEIAYTGVINDKLRGFYLSRTKTRSYGVTQFEATDARRAFPSFDEPALKATFDIRLVLDSGDAGLSNMAVASDAPGPVEGKHTVEFATTPKMSTYLVAWLVGDFKCSEAKQDDVRIRACAAPEKEGMTEFALEAAKWDLKFYDRYFGIKYPLEKLDLVAVPDFEAGAMENFGCITFRETEMLVKDDGPLDAKKEVAQTVAHEIAHQWFGDLVTPKWWDDIWLNEGFATWMETKAPAAWKPGWGFDEDAALDNDHTMTEDARTTTRAIRTQAETPGEIDELFDDIAYGKAGAVIAMVEHWEGEEVFRKGVQEYLAAHLYGNATGEDFWNAQVKVSGLPVDAVMRSFVDVPGVPLVMVGDGAKADGGWTIPVCYGGAPCKVLPPGETLRYGGSRTGDANADDKGYYRVAYAPEDLQRLETSAESTLTAPERIGLLGDEWALMSAGHGSVGEFLDLTLALKQENDPKVLGLALDKLAIVATKVASDEDRLRLDAVVRREFGPVYAALSTPKHDSEQHGDLREDLFETLGRAHDPAVMAEAKAITQDLFAKKKASDPAVADAAVTLASADGDAAMYIALMKVADRADDPDVAAAALTALARFEAPALVERTLAYAISDGVRGQDSWALIAQLLRQRPTQAQAWEFVQSHWQPILDKGSVLSGTRIVEAAGSFCTVGRRQEVASFFAAHPVPSSERALRTSLAEVDACIALRAQQEPNLRHWLDGKDGPVVRQPTVPMR